MDVKNFTKAARSAFALGLCVCVLAACTPDADFAGYGTVTGRVLDTDSLQPIPGATISIGNIISITAVIDQGGFVLRNVPVGTRTLTITATGWQPYRTSVTVVKNTPTSIGDIGLPSSLNR
jgi:outer membrane receptor for ferrienterochelin and colicins